MDKEIEDYILLKTTLLNGQLRGGINEKARELNLALINFTIVEVFESAFKLGGAVQAELENIEQLKMELGIIKDNDDSNGSKG